MGGVLGCLKEDSIQHKRDKFFKKRYQPSQEEKKSYSTQTNDTSECESESPISDPEYFKRLAIFLNELPRENRLPTEDIIDVVKENPRFAPNIISLLLMLESDGVPVQIGMVSMITQKGEYAKMIGDAILFLKMQHIKIRRSLLIEIMTDPSSALTTAHKIMIRYQASTMALLFTQLQAEKEEMTAELDFLFDELQAAEKQKVDLLVKQLVNEKPVFEYSRTSSSERRDSELFYQEEEIEFTFFRSSLQGTRNNTPASPLKNREVVFEHRRYSRSGGS